MTDTIRLAPLVVLEGIDGAGKGTQAVKLAERVQQAGLRCCLFSFPRYQETFFGARIGEFLNGEFGALEDLHPFLISLLYAGDRLESRTALLSARQQHDLVVLDRYVPSNIAHQTAKAAADQQDRLRQWIERVEYRLYELPRPDQVVLLDIPVNASQALIASKQQRSYTMQAADLHEADVDYLARVRQLYRRLAEEPQWVTIPVVQDQMLRGIEEIAEDVWASVQPLISEHCCPDKENKSSTISPGLSPR